MKNTAVLLLICFTFSLTVSAQRPKDNIVINKRPSTTSTTSSSTTNQQQFPTNTNQGKSTTQQYQNRVNHDNAIQRDDIELRYTVQQTGKNNKNTFYRVVGNIYSDNLTEALFSYNKRIVLFQVDNWDSGFFGDNIESIDGFATNQQLNQQAGGGPLYQFGNSAEREFTFDFKVKNGSQPTVKAQIYADWKVYKEYEPYLVLEYAMLNGNWIQENNPDVVFSMQFSPQGDQMVMTDLLGQSVSWTLTQDNSYVRQIGTPPVQNQNTNTNSNSSSTGAPPGGYLGGNDNSNNNSNSNTTNGSQPENYPSGGYLGGNGNSNTNGNYNSNSNSSSVNNNSTTVQTEQAYSSVWQIVDRTTLKYYNSEGIVVNFKKGE